MNRVGFSANLFILLEVVIRRIMDVEVAMVVVGMVYVMAAHLILVVVVKMLVEAQIVLKFCRRDMANPV